MEEAAHISICIPAYKNISFLKRLLDSIEIQTYSGFEVVITDDSPDDEVADLCLSHPLSPRIRYFKNKKTLGTPENWNESIRRAAGSWIKLMHDDDWFSGPDALKSFAEAVNRNPAGTFFFSGYTNVMLDEVQKPGTEVRLSGKWLNRITRNPKTLLSSNRIGPPSVTLHKNTGDIFYDAALKWLVDIDFYMRLLQNSKPYPVSGNLIAVGLGKDQVTKQVFRNPQVEVPENLYLLGKIGVSSLRNIIIYDAYWRFVRNLSLHSVNDVRKAGYGGQIPPVIVSMIRFQYFIPKSVLKSGIFSKLFMTAHYAIQFPKLTRG